MLKPSGFKIVDACSHSDQRATQGRQQTHAGASQQTGRHHHVAHVEPIGQVESNSDYYIR